jgi:Fe2+ transport system protein B
MTRFLPVCCKLHSERVISGVGSVIVFLPQILILFLFILLLEDLGYMGRAAFLMDRIMGARACGRAFIPLLSSFACAIQESWRRGSSTIGAIG